MGSIGESQDTRCWHCLEGSMHAWGPLVNPRTLDVGIVWRGPCMGSIGEFQDTRCRHCLEGSMHGVHW